MRIAIVSNTLVDPRPCGTKTMLVELIRRWTNHQITIVVQDDAQRAHLAELLPGGDWKAHLVPFNHRRMIFKWLVGLGSLAPIIGEHDIYLSGWHWPLGKLDRPFVGIVHDLIPLTEPRELDNSLKRNIYRWLYRRSLLACCERAAAVVTVSQSTSNDLRAIRPVRMPPIMNVIPHCVDVEYWRHPATDLGILQRHNLTGSRYVLGLGQHVANKNFRRLVEAFASHVSADVKLVLAGGEGVETPVLRSFIASNDLADRVIFTGFVVGDALRALMQHAAVFAFPSLREGFGIPAIEAFAAGIPVVCSNVSSLPEVAADAAMLVDPTDANAIGQAFARVLADESLRRSLIERGRARANAFSWDTAAAKYLDVFEHVRRGAHH